MKLIAFVIFASLPVSQMMGQINLEEIRTLTSDSSSRYFYDTLVVDFLEAPNDFEMTKSICLYYGKLYSRFYKPYNFSEAETNFEEFFRRGNYQRAIALGERILEKDPVNFMILLQLLKCYFEAKDEARALEVRARVQVLHRAILHSGSGEDEAAALKVIAIADEYGMMRLMNVEPVSRNSQMKSSSVIDRWKIRPMEKGKKKDLYFELLINRETLPDSGN